MKPQDLIMRHVDYEGVKTLMVYFIPKKTKVKKIQQFPEHMCYLGRPFDKIVEFKMVKLWVEK